MARSMRTRRSSFVVIGKIDEAVPGILVHGGGFQWLGRDVPEAVLEATTSMLEVDRNGFVPFAGVGSCSGSGAGVEPLELSDQSRACSFRMTSRTSS